MAVEVTQIVSARCRCAGSVNSTGKTAIDSGIIAAAAIPSSTRATIS